MIKSLVLCQRAGLFLASLMTKDNKEDYDRTRTRRDKNVPQAMQAYMERANKRAEIYDHLRRSLYDHILIYEWTSYEEVCNYLRRAYFERVDHVLGEILA